MIEHRELKIRNSYRSFRWAPLKAENWSFYYITVFMPHKSLMLHDSQKIIFHFWESYKFPLDLYLHLILVLYVSTYYLVWLITLLKKIKRLFFSNTMKVKLHNYVCKCTSQPQFFYTNSRCKGLEKIMSFFFYCLSNLLGCFSKLNFLFY